MIEVYLYGAGITALFFAACVGYLRKNLKIIETVLLSVFWPITFVYSVFRFLGEMNK